MSSYLQRKDRTVGLLEMAIKSRDYDLKTKFPNMSLRNRLAGDFYDLNLTSDGKFFYIVSPIPGADVDYVAAFGVGHDLTSLDKFIGSSMLTPPLQKIDFEEIPEPLFQVYKSELQSQMNKLIRQKNYFTKLKNKNTGTI